MLSCSLITKKLKQRFSFILELQQLQTIRWLKRQKKLAASLNARLGMPLQTVNTDKYVKKGRTEHNYTISSTSASKNYIVLKRNISKLRGVYKCFIVIQRNISLKIFVSNIWWYNVFHLYVATPLSRNCLGIQS